jgi:hypothetical protein
MDSQNCSPEDEFLDQIDSEALQEVTMGSPISINKVNKVVKP